MPALLLALNIPLVSMSTIPAVVITQRPEPKHVMNWEERSMSGLIASSFGPCSYRITKYFDLQFWFTWREIWSTTYLLLSAMVLSLFTAVLCVLVSTVLLFFCDVVSHFYSNPLSLAAAYLRLLNTFSICRCVTFIINSEICQLLILTPFLSLLDILLSLFLAVCCLAIFLFDQHHCTHYFDKLEFSHCLPVHHWCACCVDFQMN